jgi:hypothetical protein
MAEGGWRIRKESSGSEGSAVKKGIACAPVVLFTLLTTCAPKPWERDPDVQAAKRACKGLPEGDQYACVEDRAVETLNPDVCRLAGMWIDDMCLQAIYEAADDPAICDQLFLDGVRPTCREYYQRPAVDFAIDSVLSVGGELGHTVVEYQVAVTHIGNRAIEDLEAALVFPEAAGLPAQLQLERTEMAPADLVEPNQARIYEGEIAWEIERSKEAVSAVLDGAKIRLTWSFQGERHKQLFPLSTYHDGSTE